MDGRGDIGSSNFESAVMVMLGMKETYPVERRAEGPIWGAAVAIWVL